LEATETLIEIVNAVTPLDGPKNSTVVLVVETYPNLTFTFLLIPLVEYTLMNKRVLFMNCLQIFQRANPLRTVKVATILLGLLLLPGIIGLAVFLLTLLGFMWMQILLVLAIVFILQYLLAPGLVLRSVRARDPMPSEAWLLDTLSELKARMGYKKKVELKVAEVEVPNAFAVGNIFRRVIVVHGELLRVLVVFSVFRFLCLVRSCFRASGHFD
jgi:Zn-dependent protease with chaperone function